MDYKKHYDLLIRRARNRILDCYVEEHHIIPECFFINRSRKGPRGWLEGNPNASENLVLLTPEEHYVAHQLLVKIYPKQRQLIKGAILMTVHDSNKRSKNKLYGWIRRKFADFEKRTWEEKYGKEKADKLKARRREVMLGSKMSEESNSKKSKSAIGRTHSEEAIQKMKNSAKGRNKGKTYEEIYGEEEGKRLREIRSESNRKRIHKPHSQETIEKIRNQVKSRIWITNGIISKHVPKNNPMPDGFCYGRIIKRKKK